MDLLMWAWLALCCCFYHVPFEQAVAVAHIESRTKHQAFRVGPLGKGTYGGPFGVRNCFEGWDNPYCNIQLGVRALARLTRKHGSFWRALHKYNVEWDSSYEAAIKDAIRRYRNGILPGVPVWMREEVTRTLHERPQTEAALRR